MVDRKGRDLGSLLKTQIFRRCSWGLVEFKSVHWWSIYSVTNRLFFLQQKEVKVTIHNNELIVLFRTVILFTDKTGYWVWTVFLILLQNNCEEVFARKVHFKVYTNMANGLFFSVWLAWKCFIMKWKSLIMRHKTYPTIQKFRVSL